MAITGINGKNTIKPIINQLILLVFAFIIPIKPIKSQVIRIIPNITISHTPFILPLYTIRTGIQWQIWENFRPKFTSYFFQKSVDISYRVCYYIVTGRESARLLSRESDKTSTFTERLAPNNKSRLAEGRKALNFLYPIVRYRTFRAGHIRKVKESQTQFAILSV